MKVIDVRCNGCGAPLSIAEGVRFATCRFCNTQLAVECSDSAFFTDAIGETAANTRAGLQELRMIRLQNALLQLERDYLIESESVERTDSGDEGRPVKPKITLPMFLLLFVLPVLFFWIVKDIELAGSSPRLFLGLVIATLIVAWALNSIGKTKALDSAAARYQAKRDQILAELKTIEDAAPPVNAPHV